MVKYGFSMVMLFFCLSACYAADAMKCVPVKVRSQNKTIILPGVQKARTVQLYFIKNKSQHSLWVDHPIKHRSASAGWSSYLHADHWSVLLLNRKSFSLSCAVIQPGKVDYLDCAKAIEVCTPAHTHLSSRKGTYWLAEDKSWDDLILGLAKKGVKF